MKITGNFPKFVDFLGYFLGIVAIISCILVNGFYLSLNFSHNLLFFQQIIAFLFLGLYAIKYFNSISKTTFIKRNILALFFIFLFITVFIINELVLLNSNFEIPTSRELFHYQHLFFLLLQFFLVINSIISFAKLRDKWLLISENPSRIMVFSFFLTIVVGGFLLKLPRCSTDLSWVDAFFISTSAVCVTGLSSIDVPNVLTFEGQLVLMCLIQVGGLGIVTLTTFVVLFFQRGLRLRDQMMMTDVMDDDNFSKISMVLTIIIIITFGFELIGAVTLYISWLDFPFDNVQRIFYAVFHSVSAYCNAGFSVIPQGLENPMFSNHAPTLITIMFLIIFGGIGFYTYIYFLTGGKKNNPRMALQIKMILIGTVVLIFGGALFVWLFQRCEWNDLSAKQQILNSFFASVTSRTAGFSNFNFGELLYPAALIVMLLMYIGASPNSTAGGIKITTLITLLFSVWAFIRGKERVEIGWNTINKAVVRRSLVVFFISMVIIFFSGIILSYFEPEKNIFDLYFEVVSAFGTVGLTRGVTMTLTSMSKIILIFIMFFGRVGLFTLAVAIGEDTNSQKYKFAETNIMVG